MQLMISNTITQSNPAVPTQVTASKQDPKTATPVPVNAPVKKDTLELSDASQQLKAANAVKQAKTLAAAKLAKNLATIKAQKAVQAKKDLAASYAKKAAQEEATEAPSEKVQEKGAL
jgi:hypothetical protein